MKQGKLNEKRCRYKSVDTCRSHQHAKNQQLLLESMRDNKKIYMALIANKPHKIFFLRRVDNISDYLLNAAAFVLSSIFERAPIRLLEALSAGRAPICTPVGGIKNVITKDTGFFSAEVSEAAYTAALKAYLPTP